MHMSLRLRIVATSIVIVVLIVCAKQVLTDRELRIRAEERAAAADKRIADREVEHRAAIKKIDDEYAKAKTPQQIVKYVDRIVPSKIENVVAEEGAKTLPDAPSVQKEDDHLVARINFGDVIVPKENFKLLADKLNACEKTDLALTKCEQDKADLKQKADEWEKAAKGGSKLRRIFSTSLKYGAGFVSGYIVRAATSPRR
jgi:hypothetical protein